MQVNILCNIKMIFQALKQDGDHGIALNSFQTYKRKKS